MSKSAAKLLMACSTVTSAQSLISAENLLSSPPKDFKIGYQSSHDNRQIAEWMPASETVEDWTQMLTVQMVPQEPC